MANDWLGSFLDPNRWLFGGRQQQQAAPAQPQGAFPSSFNFGGQDYAFGPGDITPQFIEEFARRFAPAGQRFDFGNAALDAAQGAGFDVEAARGNLQQGQFALDQLPLDPNLQRGIGYGGPQFEQFIRDMSRNPEQGVLAMQILSGNLASLFKAEDILQGGRVTDEERGSMESEQRRRNTANEQGLVQALTQDALRRGAGSTGMTNLITMEAANQAAQNQAVYQAQLVGAIGQINRSIDTQLAQLHSAFNLGDLTANAFGFQAQAEQAANTVENLQSLLPRQAEAQTQTDLVNSILQVLGSWAQVPGNLSGLGGLF